MKHQNKEITFSFIALFTKCIPNGYIMTLKCPAPSKFSTSRAMGRAYGYSLPTGIRPICHCHAKAGGHLGSTLGQLFSVKYSLIGSN